MKSISEQIVEDCKRMGMELIIQLDQPKPNEKPLKRGTEYKDLGLIIDFKTGPKGLYQYTIIPMRYKYKFSLSGSAWTEIIENTTRQ